MQYPAHTCAWPLPLSLVLILAAGCSSNPRQPQQAQRTEAEAAARCPSGYTMTCEARRTGRIRHGSFGKNYEKCACVPEGFELPPSPVIPRL